MICHTCFILSIVMHADLHIMVFSWLSISYLGLKLLLQYSHAFCQAVSPSATHLFGYQKHNKIEFKSALIWVVLSGPVGKMLNIWCIPSEDEAFPCPWCKFSDMQCLHKGMYNVQWLHYLCGTHPINGVVKLDKLDIPGHQGLQTCNMLRRA